MKKIILGLIALSSISANAIELQYPTWHSPHDVPFKAYHSDRKNKIEADKICLIHTDREFKSNSFKIKKMSLQELDAKFPNSVSTGYNITKLAGRVLIDGQYLPVPENAHYAKMEPLFVISEVSKKSKVRIFESITCE